MKRLGIIFFVASFLIVAITAANASYYNRPLWSTGAPAPAVGGKQMPHGGFVDSTNRCKDCHAVHLATGNYKMLQDATTGQTACAYCHGDGGIIAAVNGIILNTSGHGLVFGVSGTLYPPDDATPGFSIDAGDWGCGSCHSVHNRNTIQAVTDRVNTSSPNTNALLKGNPDDQDVVAPWQNGFAGLTVTLSLWCAECHGANYGTYGQSKSVAFGQNTQLAYGHDAGATQGFQPVVNAGVTYAYFSSPVTQAKGVWGTARVPRCNQCHAAGASARTDVGWAGWVTGQQGQVTRSLGFEGYFPHTGYSRSYSLLKNSSFLTAGTSRLDDVCNDCHNTASLP